MATLHGSWLLDEGELFVWGEAWQAGMAAGTVYPYGVDREGTAALLAFANLDAEAIAPAWQIRELRLPGREG